MYIHVEELPGVSVIVPDKNKLLGLEAAEMQNTLLDLIAKGNNTIAVNLSGVDFLASWGIGMLIHASVTCTNRDINFYLYGVNNKVMSILKKVKLDQIFDIRES